MPIPLLFFISGIPALLYQIVWQRVLFSFYGTNIESVTAIVAAFILGLGLGGWLGGKLSLYSNNRLQLFAGVELLIGLFGLISLPLFDAVGGLTAGLPIAQSGTIAFALILLPTLLMGATLPLLTAYLVDHQPNVGKQVGTLYFVNTLGSATACFLAAFYLMGNLGLNGSIIFAVGFNLLVASGAWWLSQRPHQGPSRQTQEQAAPALPIAAKTQRNALLLAAGAGFVSLSWEIMWVRSFAFLTGGMAKVFALVLGSFLLGIALGSLFARGQAKQYAPDDPHFGRILMITLLLASVAGYLLLPGIAYLAQQIEYGFALQYVAISAALWGAVLPLAAHLGITADGQAGAGMGKIYLANILGSVAGSLVVGFWLMDHLGIAQLATLNSLLGLAMAVAVAFWLIPYRWERLAGIAASLLVALFMVSNNAVLFNQFYEKLLLKQDFTADKKFAQQHENRSGVIGITPAGVVYGGGVYDGRLATGLFEAKGLFRPYSISAFHKKPAKVLMIGLSMGAWGRIVASHPQLESMTVVEINRGYPALIETHDHLAPVLNNPKVKVVYDDGRRWMRANPEAKFDFIMMNTTWHWRAYASNILSSDFMQIVKAHLAPGGRFMFNATGSLEAQRTAALSFPHVWRFSNNVVASMDPIPLDIDNWKKQLLAYRIDGEPVVDPMDDEQLTHLQQLEQQLRTVDDPQASYWSSMGSREDILAASEGLITITDDNMGVEWHR
uniref:Putative spermidine synthase (Putrescine aminopropyltransferase) n=1 Tax=Magnetococcus massalia (strain MO-1) TaxID=451514 RepID=A0A1S7LBW9_MAGMO|nr:putative spermidine synthase (Putrescine aminopropyltransferase) [Candidatus Magnetococcus massalia]